jgi:uncharacterized membrane protein
MNKSANVYCQISKKLVPADMAKPGYSVRPSIFELIKKVRPNFKEDEYVSEDELEKIKIEHVKSMLMKDKGQLSEIERQVAETTAKHDFMSKDFTHEEEDRITFGEKLSDKIAEFGGSWKFIISFILFMCIWIGGNVLILSSKSFDPYPFILLNLILSCIAALQAPVILMSQNRSGMKDRQRAINDFQVNLKSEIEIRHLHEKVDHLITTQIQHIHELQQIQMEILEDINKKLKAK